MDAHAVLESVVAQVYLLLENPLALPAVVGAACVLLSVVLLYALSSGSKKGRKGTKKSAAGGTTVDANGVRRSTRSVGTLGEARSGCGALAAPNRRLPPRLQGPQGDKPQV